MDLSDEELELFEMAYHLHLPLYKLLHEMPYDEFLGWQAYFSKRPVGWREDHRTRLILMSAGAENNAIYSALPSLSVIEKDGGNKHEKTIVQSLKNSVIYQKMLMATGGDDPHLICKDDP